MNCTPRVVWGGSSPGRMVPRRGARLGRGDATPALQLALETAWGLWVAPEGPHGAQAGMHQPSWTHPSCAPWSCRAGTPWGHSCPPQGCRSWGIPRAPALRDGWKRRGMDALLRTLGHAALGTFWGHIGQLPHAEALDPAVHVPTVPGTMLLPQGCRAAGADPDPLLGAARAPPAAAQPLGGVTSLRGAACGCRGFPPFPPRPCDLSRVPFLPGWF